MYHYLLAQVTGSLTALARGYYVSSTLLVFPPTLRTCSNSSSVLLCSTEPYLVLPKIPLRVTPFPLASAVVERLSHRVNAINDHSKLSNLLVVHSTTGGTNLIQACHYTMGKIFSEVSIRSKDVPIISV